jgi:hypothetical protein
MGDSRDWRSWRTATQLESVIGRLGIVVTRCLHGLMPALKNGIPVLTANPVAGAARSPAGGRVRVGGARGCEAWKAMVPGGRG